jgi:hypothetical protein
MTTRIQIVETRPSAGLKPPQTNPQVMHAGTQRARITRLADHERPPGTPTQLTQCKFTLTGAVGYFFTTGVTVYDGSGILIDAAKASLATWFKVEGAPDTAMYLNCEVDTAGLAYIEGANVPLQANQIRLTSGIASSEALVQNGAGAEFLNPSALTMVPGTRLASGQKLAADVGLIGNNFLFSVPTPSAGLLLLRAYRPTRGDLAIGADFDIPTPFGVYMVLADGQSPSYVQLWDLQRFATPEGFTVALATTRPVSEVGLVFADDEISTGGVFPFVAVGAALYASERAKDIPATGGTSAFTGLGVAGVAGGPSSPTAGSSSGSIK